MIDSELNQLKHNLADSCTTLNSKYNVLNNTQLKKCRDSILGHSGDNENEILMFGEDRDDKIKQAYELINRVYSYLDNIDSLYSDTGPKNPSDKSPDIKALKHSLNQIVKNLDTLLLERYNDKEYGQYNSLLDYYNKIEKNRKLDSGKQVEIDTINKMIVTENKKLEKSKYTVRLIVLIILMCLFVILLILFIKF
jgi:hypothetical protein